jgi:hypothetical protein
LSNCGTNLLDLAWNGLSDSDFLDPPDLLVAWIKLRKTGIWQKGDSRDMRNITYYGSDSLPEDDAM